MLTLGGEQSDDGRYGDQDGGEDHGRRSKRVESRLRRDDVGKQLDHASGLRDEKAAGQKA